MMSTPSVEDRRILAKAVLYGLAVTTMLLLILSLYYLVQVGRSGQETRKLLVAQNKTLLASSGLLVECTTDPAERKDATAKVGEDDCFVRAQNRTAAAVGLIGDITIRAACAAQTSGDIPAIQRCVRDVNSYIKAQSERETP